MIGGYAAACICSIHSANEESKANMEWIVAAKAKTMNEHIAAAFIAEIKNILTGGGQAACNEMETINDWWNGIAAASLPCASITAICFAAIATQLAKQKQMNEWTQPTN